MLKGATDYQGRHRQDFTTRGPHEGHTGDKRGTRFGDLEIWFCQRLLETAANIQLVSRNLYQPVPSIQLAVRARQPAMHISCQTRSCTRAKSCMKFSIKFQAK